MVGVPRRVLVEWLKVHCAARGAIGLGRGDHTLAPCDWCAHLHLLQDPEVDVSLQPCLDSLLPEEWDRGRGVYCYRDCVLVDEETREWASHHWECLVFTGVECTGRVSC